MKPRQFSVTVLIALALSGFVFAASSITPNALLGVWKEKDGDTVYSFQKDHEFEFRKTYIDFGKPESDARRVSVTRHIGAWQTGTNICWVGNAGTKGNLMIHIGTDRCCHLAYFLGKNLILNNVGNPGFGGVCDDRVLVREK